MKPKKKNIGILTSHFSWDGGVDFLVFLSKGIAYEPDNHIFLLINYGFVNFCKFFVLRFTSVISSPKKFFRNKEWNLYEKKITTAFIENNISFKKVYYFHGEHSLIAAVRKNDINVVLPTMRAFSNKFNWIGYIPDLQHKYFPESFSEKEKKRRDRLYGQLIKKSQKLIVNSIAVKEDIKQYYQATGDNIISLPFIPLLTGELATVSDSVLDKYNISNPYFLISNQFWKHKNHLTAFMGFVEFCKRIEKRFELICTGNTADERFPHLFSELLEYINNSGYKENFKILGFISKEDQLSLLEKCQALIQPTLFEGGPGGGSVYNALALGKRSVVSDISINQEIKSELVFFFESTNSHELAEVLIKVALLPPIEPDVAMINKQNLEKLKNVMNQVLS